jgi:hypothetical protein
MSIADADAQRMYWQLMSQLQCFKRLVMSLSPSDRLLKPRKHMQRDFERESFSSVERVFDVMDCDENRVGRYSAIQQISSIPVYF